MKLKIQSNSKAPRISKSFAFQLWKFRHRVLLHRFTKVMLKHGVLYVRTNDRRAFLLSKSQGNGIQKNLLDFFEGLIKSNRFDYFIDVGANYGEFTLIASRIISTVVSIEPDTQVYRALQKSFGNDSNVQVVQSLVSDYVGLAEFYKLRGYSGGSSMRSAHLKTLTKENFWGTNGHISSKGQSVTTLRRVIHDIGEPYSGSILIKVDVEGLEFEVLDGLGQLPSDCPNIFVILEFSPKIIRNLGGSTVNKWSLLQRYPGVVLEESNTPKNIDLRNLPSLPKRAPETSVDVFFKVC